MQDSSAITTRSRVGLYTTESRGANNIRDLLPPLWATGAAVQGGEQEVSCRGLGYVTGAWLDS